MEQAIGMTDTAFLGRVGEIELGASAIAGVYYIAIFMIGFGFSIGSQILMARRNGEKRYSEIGDIFRKEIFRDRRHILSGRVFHDFSGSGRVYSYRVDNTVAASKDTFIAEYLCCSRELYSLEGFRILLLIRCCDVQGFLCRHYSDQDSYSEFACDGGLEHCFQLYPDFR